MTGLERVTDFVTEHSTLVVVVMFVLTAGIGSGMFFLEDAADLDQFEFGSEEGDALDYINENFDADDNTTAAQIVIKDENTLSRESLIGTIELQQEIEEDDRIEETLAADPFADVASIVATTAIQEERSEELGEREAAIEADREELLGTAADLSDGINETREIEREFIELNSSFERGEIDQETYDEERTRLQDERAAVETETAELLSEGSFGAYQELLSEARTLEGEIAEIERDHDAGEIDDAERDRQLADVEAEMAGLYDRIETDVLGEEFADLDERGAELERDTQELQELDPTLEEQHDQLEGMSDEDVDSVVNNVLGDDAPREVLAFVPTDFEPGSGTTDARQLFVTQFTAEEVADGEAPPEIVDSQLAMAELVEDRYGDDAFVFGGGIISDEIDRSMADSMAIVLPLALLFVVVVLSIAYRDPLDIILGVTGIGMVLVWTFGFMGWTGIAFNQILIAVPVLLVGLSIDYAIHVFMRHRERRLDDGYGDTRSAMSFVLVGLGAALLWVTVTAVIGFLSNLVSPVAPIREFGVVSAFGIASTLLIFGTFVPAAKVGLDAFLEARGWDRRKRAFGTGGGISTRVLSGGKTLAKTAPVAVVVVALLITGIAAVGGAQVDTSFQQEDFIADEPPGWMESLPGSLAPGEYSVKQNLEFVNERFLRQDSSTQVLMREDITSDDTLTDIDSAADAAAEQDDVVVVLSDGSADVRTSLTAMEDVAAENESFNETFRAADTTGDGVPDENVTGVYDAFFEVSPDRASEFIYRTDDGEYEATRMVISVRGSALPSEATDSTRTIAASLDTDTRSAIATGQLVVFNVIEQELFNTVIESLLVTLIAVFAFLMVAYRFVHGSAILGAVTLTPIVLSVAWILGTMKLLGISFNVLTGTITSLTIGLGVAYNIHISERYRLELRQGRQMWEAMERAVTGTGGALLGSAATTAGGFGMLAFAILPPLQQFGIITGITIIYAFLGSVFILPTFLVLWTTYLAPDIVEGNGDTPDETTPGEAVTGDDA